MKLKEEEEKSGEKIFLITFFLDSSLVIGAWIDSPKNPIYANAKTSLTLALVYVILFVQSHPTHRYASLPSFFFAKVH